MFGKYPIDEEEGVDMARGNVAYHVRNDLAPLGGSVASAYASPTHLFVEVTGLDTGNRDVRRAMGKGAEFGGELYEGPWPPEGAEQINW